jgi:hypothetical protein
VLRLLSVAVLVYLPPDFCHLISGVCSWLDRQAAEAKEVRARAESLHADA